MNRKKTIDIFSIICGLLFLMPVKKMDNKTILKTKPIVKDMTMIDFRQKRLKSNLLLDRTLALIDFKAVLFGRILKCIILFKAMFKMFDTKIMDSDMPKNSKEYLDDFRIAGRKNMRTLKDGIEITFISNSYVFFWKILRG